MKLKCLIIVGLILTILAMGVVSATSDVNATDALTANEIEDEPIVSSFDDECMEDLNENDIDIYVYPQVDCNEGELLTIDAPEYGVSGNVSVSIDETECYNMNFNEMQRFYYEDGQFGWYYLNITDLNYNFVETGAYNITINYFNGNYNPVQYKGMFTLMDFDTFDMTIYNDVVLGEEYDYFARIDANDSSSGRVIVEIDGAEYFNKLISECNRYVYETLSFYRVGPRDLNRTVTYGLHNVTVRYVEEDKRPFILTGEVEFITSDEYGPEEFGVYYDNFISPYNPTGIVSVGAPSKINGKITVFVDGVAKYSDMIEETCISEITLKNMGIESVGDYDIVIVFNSTNYNAEVADFILTVVEEEDYKIEFEDTIMWGDESAYMLNILCPYNVTGKIEVSIQNYYKEAVKDIVPGVWLLFSPYDLKWTRLGNYTMVVTHIDEYGGRKVIFQDEIEFKVDDDYLTATIVDVDINDDDMVGVTVYCPSDISNLMTVICNGYRIYREAINQNGIIKWNITEFHITEPGVYPVRVECEFGAYTHEIATGDMFVYGIYAPPQIEYMSGDGNITLYLPEDIGGFLTVSIGDNDTIRVPVKDSMASYTLSNLKLGKYNISAGFEGAHVINPFNRTVAIIPDVIYESCIYYPDGADVSIILPENYNGNFTVTIQGKKFNTTVINGNAKVALYNLTYEDYANMGYMTESMGVTYEDESYDFEKYYEIRLYDVLPNFDLNISMEDKFAINDEIIIFLNIPRGSRSDMDIYVDGIKMGYYIRDYSMATLNPSDIGVGQHDLLISYLGDDYFNPCTATAKFEIAYSKFRINENVVVGEYDNTASFIGVDDAEGFITLYIDGKEYDSEIVKEGNAEIDLEDLPLGIHEYELRYSGDKKYSGFSKRGQLNVTYYSLVNIPAKYHGYKLGETIRITVYLPKDAEGNVIVTANGKEYQKAVDKGEVEFELSDLKLGENNLTVYYGGDDSYYAKMLETATIELESGIVAFDTINYDETGKVMLNVAEDVTGKLTVYINDVEYKNASISNGNAVVEVSGIPIGNYRIKAIFDGNAEIMEYNGWISVTPKITMSENVTFGEKLMVAIDFGSNFTGNISVGYSGPTTEITVPARIVQIHVEVSKIGYNYIDSLLIKNDTVSLSMSMDSVFVTPKQVNVPSEMLVGEDKYFYINFGNVTGSVTLYFQGVSHQMEYDVSLENGIVNHSLSKLPADKYTVFVYSDFINQILYEVNVKKPELQIETSSSGNVANTLDINMNGASGKIIVSIDGESQLLDLVDGKASVDLSDLAVGKHIVKVKYSGNDNFSKFEKTFNVSLITPKIIAKDMSMLYTAGTQYSVTIYDKFGNLAKNTEVVFEVNGKRLLVTKTNDKGVATVKLTQIPGTYKITTRALGESITKKLTVKHIVKLQKVKVKRSAKKLVIKVILSKVNGKYLKGKKVTLKFKGKKYTVKTNKKGVAKFTIKKKVLKKLKKGKKVTYHATYLKDTVKYSVKVKK